METTTRRTRTRTPRQAVPPDGGRGRYGPGMQVNELKEDRLRELATFRSDGARVLSIFLNLDPTEFAAPPARATEIASVLDAADRQVREADTGLTHAQKTALRADIERSREFLKTFSPKGAHGFVLYACSPAGLFEGIRLPRPVQTRAVIDDSPFVEPLVELSGLGTWMVLLINRETGRMLRGDREHLDELPPVEDHVHGQHKQGGWSQARYQRSVDEEVKDHLKRVADAAFLHFKRAPFDQILLGGPTDVLAEFEPKLHDYLRRRVAGRIDIDVENTSAEGVRTAAGPRIEQLDRDRVQEALERLREGLSKGARAAAGLDDVLDALNERRVETLLLNDGFVMPGCSCPQCGWVGSLNGGRCPADGTELDCRNDVVESAVELALTQSAAVLVVHDEGHTAELEGHGSIAAVLRF